MNTMFSSRLALGVAVATTSLVLLAGCDRRPTDVPPPTSSDVERDRTSPPPVPGTPATPMSPGTPPASDPATPAAPGTPPPGGTTQ